ncbi:MAG: hypothetical protein Fur0046_14630 [Cyanobacteria bacterium J069]|nr:MAG: hypothetical protein D6742_17195 [Cyanobacteria bacterium J069]
MNSLNWIENVTSRIKLLSIKRVLIALFASFLLISNVACAGSTSAREVPRSANPNSAASSASGNREVITERGIYKTRQDYQGGMNGYADDTSYDSAADAKAQRLINRAEQNLQNRVTNPKELVDNITNRNVLPEQAKEASEKLSDSIEETRKGLVEGTEQGTRNLKSNLEQAKDAAPAIFDKAVQNAKGATQDLQQGTKDLGEGAQRVVDRASDEVRN